jgi:NTP pyrophosphatase (non-canonical NTP hydrolase)
MEHSSLAQLATLISRLGQSCPWTRAQSPRDMLFWTRKECLEVEEVIRKPAPIDSKALTKELGDVLFDVLMMIEVSGREHEVTLESCCASACEKLRQRSPYLFSGASPKSIEEAEAMWQAGKRQEAADEKDEVPAPVLVPPAAHSPPPMPTLPKPQPQHLSTATSGAVPVAVATSGAVPAAVATSGAVPAAVATSGAVPVAVATSGAVPAAVAISGAVYGEGDDSSDEEGLAEWEADFRRDAGPTSDDALGSEDDDEPLSDDLLEELRHEVRATSRTSSRLAAPTANGQSGRAQTHGHELSSAGA